LFGEVIREAREGIAVSQETLADLAGLHRTYISLLERGLRNPSLTVITKLAEALDTSPSVLMSAYESLSKRKGK
jgi:transcriptional regulator with XRE-family HTH domain